jgi:Fe2+ transport system protein FeoA
LRFELMVRSYIPLSGMCAGSSGMVDSIHLECDDSFRLREMGFMPGARLRLVRRAPLGDPIEVEIGGAHLALRHADAALIQVRIIPGA